MNDAYKEMPLREWVRIWRNQLTFLDIHMRAVFEGEPWQAARSWIDPAAEYTRQAKETLEAFEKIADQSAEWSRQP